MKAIYNRHTSTCMTLADSSSLTLHQYQFIFPILYPLSNPLAAVSKLGQFCPLHFASVRSVAQMGTWLQVGM